MADEMSRPVTGEELRAAFPRGPDPEIPWSKPLRLHLSIVIVTLLVCVCAPLMWLTYQHGRSAAIDAAQEKMRLLSLHALDHYRNVFDSGYSAIETGSVLAPMASAPPAELDAKRDFLLKALQGSPKLDSVYAGYPDGSFIQAVSVRANPRWGQVLSAPPDTAFALITIGQSPTGMESNWQFLDAKGGLIVKRHSDSVIYDPRQRPWYRTAVARDGPVSVGPYATAATRSLSLTLAAPMEKDRGVVTGADVLLETISSLLNQEAVSEHARGYVFDSQQRLIVHSDPAIMAGILETLSNPRRDDGKVPYPGDPAYDAVRNLLRTDAGASGGVVHFSVGGVPYMAQISPVGFSGLLKGNTLVIAAPLDDFVGPSNRLLIKTLLIAGAFLVAGILVALVVARLISNALFSLAGEARQIADLDFKGRGSYRSMIAEINILANALAAARDAIRNFSLYVPRELVRKIVSAGQAEAGVAVRQDVTVLFTDIRDFTTISEQYSPESVTAMLSSYFQLMNEIVEWHNGVIVQYLGDSIFGMWNAPVADPKHVENGCRCALTLKAAIDEFNAANRAAGRPEFITRFGLHTGPAVVGSVGAETRRQYTAMGDTVNVASRLEGMNKQFGTSILTSGAVAEKAGGRLRFRSLGLAQAKGRFEQIEVFELLR